jgi:lipopolysaccharide transport system ATP-binding protein
MGSIQVTQLGKAYKQYPTRWSRLAEWLIPFSAPRHQLTWVLQDVSFQVNPGEALGIIGVNGAGKSTLLKMITGTTQPNAGHIDIRGRVAALLELGMGFHPDFSGRQNVFMAGQLLGLSMEELHALMPEIEAFAEIGEYIDHPVRTYSSGMQMRLAFSVATARRPDVLIVDEALSVGDAYFQHKSFDRIREFRKAGTTLLIVSHDRQAIQSLCDRAILLVGGRLALEGAPEEVMDFYSAMLAEKEQQTVRQERLAGGQVRTISGTGEAGFADVALINEQGQRIEVVSVGSTVTLQVVVDIKVDIPRLVLGFMIKDRMGQAIYGINTHRLNRPLENLKAGEQVTYRFEFPARLGKGNYSIALSLSRLDSHLDTNYEWRDFALVFHVINTRQPDFVGCAWLDSQVAIERTLPSAISQQIQDSKENHALPD